MQPDQTVIGDIKTLIDRIRINVYVDNKVDILPYPETTSYSGNAKIAVSTSYSEQSYSRSIGVDITDKTGQAIPMPNHVLVLLEQKTGKETDRHGLDSGSASFSNVQPNTYKLELRLKENKNMPRPNLNVGLM